MGTFFDVETQQSLLKKHRDTHRDVTNYPTLPTREIIASAEDSLPSTLPSEGSQDVVSHITSLLPALTGQSLSSRYFGFVTGGSLPVAQWADNIVTYMDQNVQVHLPQQTIATALEDKALRMLSSMLGLSEDVFEGRTITTGATGSNILGLACGREWVVKQKGGDVGEHGLLGACVQAGIKEIQVLTSGGHSSLSKAASVVGLGRSSVKELSVSGDEPWKLDIDAVEEYLKKSGTVSIIAVSAGEVNTGRYAVDGLEGWKKLKALADRYGAWIHVDGAFGIFAHLLGDNPQYSLLHQRLQGIDLADSITVDGHKVLNVPYDCGMFYTRSTSTLQAVCTNPNAAYLSSGGTSSIASPLNSGLENSRRFRALPVYAALLSEGQIGFSRMVTNMTLLSRRIASYVQASPHYDLLPEGEWGIEEVFIIVLVRAKDKALNEVLVERINETRQMYVSGTKWRGEKAVRIAVSNWKVDVERDGAVVEGILSAVAEGRTFDIEAFES